MQLQSCRLVAPTGSASCRFTEVVEGRLLGLLWPLGPLVAWLLQRQTAADLRRLNQLLEAPATSGPTQEGRRPSLSMRQLPTIRLGMSLQDPGLPNVPPN